jgi:hypothetical protein
MNETKIIIPLSPKYITDKVRIYFIEASWHQVATAFACIVFTTMIIGALPGRPGMALNIVGPLIIWGMFYKFAWTNEKYLASKSKLFYQIRKLRKQNTYSATASPMQQLNKLYPYSPKEVVSILLSHRQLLKLFQAGINNRISERFIGLLGLSHPFDKWYKPAQHRMSSAEMRRSPASCLSTLVLLPSIILAFRFI